MIMVINNNRIPKVNGCLNILFIDDYNETNP